MESSYDAEIKELKEKYRTDAGRTGTLIFLVVGLYFHVSERGVSSLFTLKGIAFLGLGMFLAGICLGVAYYAVQMGITTLVGKLVASDNVGRVLTLLAVPFLVLELTIGFLVTRWAFFAWYS